MKSLTDALTLCTNWYWTESRLVGCCFIAISTHQSCLKEFIAHAHSHCSRASASRPYYDHSITEICNKICISCTSPASRSQNVCHYYWLNIDWPQQVVCQLERQWLNPWAMNPSDCKGIDKIIQITMVTNVGKTKLNQLFKLKKGYQLNSI